MIAIKLIRSIYTKAIIEVLKIALLLFLYLIINQSNSTLTTNKQKHMNILLNLYNYISCVNSKKSWSQLRDVFHADTHSATAPPPERNAATTPTIVPTPPVGVAEAIPAAIEAADVPEAATATDCCEWSSLTSVQKSEAPLHLKLQVC